MAKEIREPDMLFKARNYRMSFAARAVRPLIMGVLNVTPDSFSDGGWYRTVKRACARAKEMAAQGAGIIDIGGESTRPGSAGVSVHDELRRVLPVVRAVARAVSVPLSIDTWKSEVACECLRAGAAIVNDVSGLMRDPRMAAVVRRFNAGVIVMHMRGEPHTMQQLTQYDQVVRDVLRELKERLRLAREAGIRRDHMAIDPGICFAKTAEHNLLLMKGLTRFHALGRPLVVGTSRKSFIGKLLDREVHERLAGSLATIGCAMARGVHVVRVHDVRETSDFITMVRAIDTAS